MLSDVLIGIDMGTGSSKGVATTITGEILATSTRPRPNSMSMPRPGCAEVDADAIWWADVVSLCQELTARLADHQLAGVCVSGVGPCLVLCDENDRPVRPAILYGIDMRATAEIEELTERYGQQAILDRGGTALTTQAVGPKALWVRRNEPEVWARASHWYNSNSYIAKRLTGEYILDHHSASQCDPLYDIHAHDWYRPWCEDVMPGLALPRLAWPTEVIGEVTPSAADATGLPAGTPVCAGTVDAWAEAFSAGVRRPGDLMLMYGSTMFFVQVLQSLAPHPKLWTTVGVDPGTYTLAAGMATSGSLTSWVQELVGGVPFERLIQEAAAVRPGADGLIMLPYFAGERTPIFDPRARGVIAGLTLRHSRAHLFRAIYEGIAFGIRQILEVLESDINPIQRLVAVGGGTQGGLWTQIVSDVTGRTQQLPAQTIGASYGDALMGAIGTGQVSASTDWTVTARTVTPTDTTRELYDGLYRIYCDLYPATKATAHYLAQLQEHEAMDARGSMP
jgi:xylulokinase